MDGVSHLPQPQGVLSSKAGRPEESTFTDVAALRSANPNERREAWRRVFRQHFDTIYGQIYRMGVTRGNVDDLVQEVFLLAYRKVEDLDRVENLGGWLRGVALRVASHHLRYHRLRSALRWKITPLMLGWTESVATPEAAVQNKRQVERARYVIARMSAKLRAVLVLVELEQCSTQATASILNLPENTVRSRRRLARAAFRRHWEQLGMETL